MIETVGEIVEQAPIASGTRLGIATPIAAEMRPGDSVAVNGVCLTMIGGDGSRIRADVGPETLRVTTLGALAAGSLVNLERPLQPDGRFGGHFVQGHVDAIGSIDALRPDADFHWLTVRFPPALAPYFILKGSVAVDGISLTVARLTATSFDVQLIPYTIEHTNLQRARAGDAVNLECDMVGKYVVRVAELAGVTFGAGDRAR